MSITIGSGVLERLQASDGKSLYRAIGTGLEGQFEGTTKGGVRRQLHKLLVPYSWTEDGVTRTKFRSMHLVTAYDVPKSAAEEAALFDTTSCKYQATDLAMLASGYPIEFAVAIDDGAVKNSFHGFPPKEGVYLDSGH